MNFCHQHLVMYYESDAMGVVHHSNYLRFFEETRVAWLHQRGLRDSHYPLTDSILAVLEVSCQHLRPAYVDELLKIYAQVRRQKLKVEFQYAIFSPRYTTPVATGKTLHVLLNREFQVQKLPSLLAAQLEKETWTETWPSNL